MEIDEISKDLNLDYDEPIFSEDVIKENMEKQIKCVEDCKEYTDGVEREAIEYLIKQLKDIKNKLEEIVRINAQ